MSFVIIPSDSYRSAAAPSYHRCGPSFNDHHHHPTNAIPRGLMGALFGDDDVVFSNGPTPSSFLTPWQELHLEQLRRQEYLEEVERRRLALIARQQQKAELERRRREAARLALIQERQRKAAIALEYQRRLEVEAYKRRQRQLEQEYAHRVTLAQQAKASQQQAKEQAAQAQKAEQKDINWEAVAAQSIFGVLDLVQHLFGGEEEEVINPAATKEGDKADGKKSEKTTEEVNAEQAKQVEVDAMQLDTSEPTTDGVDVQQSVPTDVKADVQDQREEVKNDGQQKQAKVQEPTIETKGDHLVFTYPLPQDVAARSELKSKKIGVSYDKASHTIQLTGLWVNKDSANSSSTSSADEENRGRTRSRSPKRSRVSDVDEKTGEEIIKVDDNDDGFVQVPTAAATTTTKSIRLPQGVTADNLRADLTDEGFKVYV